MKQTAWTFHTTLLSVNMWYFSTAVHGTLCVRIASDHNCVSRRLKKDTGEHNQKLVRFVFTCIMTAWFWDNNTIVCYLAHSRVYCIKSTVKAVGRESSVGMATRYGFDGPGIQSP
jgi:hypothetical protein